MRLAYFDFIHNLGGAQIANIKLLKNLADEEGYSCRVVSVFGKLDNLSSYLQASEIDHDSILNEPPISFKPSLGILLAYARLIRQTLKYFKKSSFDVVFTSSEKGLYFLTLAGLLVNRKMKVVYYSHGYDRLCKNKKLLYFICRRLVKSVWVLSPNFKQIFIDHGVAENKISIIPNFIEIGHIPGDCTDINPSQANFNILLPGSVIKAKGVMEAVAAMKILSDEGFKAHLYIAGATVDKDFLKGVEDYMKQNELESMVTILGWRKDVLCIMKKMDCILLPSYSEGMPLVVLEAMALGKMPVCSRVGALPHIIDNEKNGLLLQDTSPECISDALKLAAGDGNAALMGKKAQLFVNNTYNKQIQRQKAVSALALIG